MGAPLFEFRTAPQPGHSEMHRCVGTVASGRQCKTSGLYNCPKCDAFLCSWHVLWVEEPKGNGQGAHCCWCKDEQSKPVKMEGRSQGGWLERVKRGYYRAKEEFVEAFAKAEAETDTEEDLEAAARAFVEND